jgi:hypothetical protein
MAEKLEFKFDLLTGQSTILDTLNQAQRQAEGFGSLLNNIGSNTSFFKLSSAVAIGQAAFELAKKAVSSFTGALEGGIHAAIEKEDAINRLNISLAQTGKYSSSASNDILSFAEEMRKTTRYTDDQIISNAAYLQSLTKLDTQGLKKATQSSADLASTLGIDLQSATSLVAKSIEGNTGALSRYGIQVKKGADETENFTNTMKALSQFSGRAAADSNTFGGALAKMNNSLGEVSTSFGQVITQNPVFIAAINELSKTFNNLSDYISKNKSNLIEFTNSAIRYFGEGLLKLSPIFNFINESLVSTLGIIRLSIQGWSQLLQTMSGLQIITEMVGKFVTGLLEIPKGIVMLLGYMADLAKQSTMMQKAFDKAGISLEDVSKGYSDIEKKIEDLQVSVASVDFDKTTLKALDNVDELLGKSQNFLEKQTNSVEKIGNKIIDFSNTAIDKQKQILRNNDQIYIETDTFFNRIGTAFSSFSAIGKRLSDIFNKIDSSKGLTKFQEMIDNLAPTLLTATTKGAEGARAAIVTLGAAAADSFMPGLGKVVGPFLDMFSKGPEYTKKMVSEFVRSIPIIIDNIIASLPAITEALAETIPEVVTAFSVKVFTGESLVIFTRGLLKAFAIVPKEMAKGFLEGIKTFPKTIVGSFIKEMPRIIAEFISGAAKFIGVILEGAFKYVVIILEGAVDFVAEILIGAAKFTAEIIRGAAIFVWNIVGSAYQFVAGIVAGAGRFVDELVAQIPAAGGILSGGGGGGFNIIDPGSWFAKGGLVMPQYAEKGMLTPFVPRGTDTVPSMLTPGEYVVDRSLTRKLTDYLNAQEKISNNEVILTQILFELKKPQTINTEITLNKKTFADLLLDLSRNNARVTV